MVESLNKGDYEGTARTLEHFDDKSRLPDLRMRRYAEAAKFRSNAPNDY